MLKTREKTISRSTFEKVDGKLEIDFQQCPIIKELREEKQIKPI